MRPGPARFGCLLDKLRSPEGTSGLLLFHFPRRRPAEGQAGGCRGRVVRGGSAGTPGTAPCRAGPYRRCGAVRGLSGGWGGRNPAAISATCRRGGFSDVLTGLDFFAPGREEGRGRRPTGASSGTATGTCPLPSVCSLAGAKPIARSPLQPSKYPRLRISGVKVGTFSEIAIPCTR